MTERRNHFECWTSGLDPALQGIGSDPWGNNDWTGLVVPTLATASAGGNPLKKRYNFMCCGFQVPEGATAHIVGWRQLLTIGTLRQQGADALPAYWFEREVTTPTNIFPDGNATFHLRALPGKGLASYVGSDAAPFFGMSSFAFRMSKSPALLYEAATFGVKTPFYTDLTGYTPPFDGRLPGVPIAHLGTMHGTRTQWTTHGAWSALDCWVNGPTFVAGFASVRQTAGIDLSRYQTLAMPAGLPPEVQFIIDFSPSAEGRGGAVQFHRVAMALDVEMCNDARVEAT